MRVSYHKKNGISFHKKFKFLLGFFLLPIVLIFTLLPTIKNVPVEKPYIFDPSWHYVKVSNNGMIGDGVCQVPDVSPFDTRVLPYLVYYPTPSCSHYQKDLIKTLPEGVITFNDQILSANDLSKENMKCVYQEVYRRSGTDDAVQFRTEKLFKQNATVNSDLVRVKCRKNSVFSGIIYDNVLPLIKSNPNRTPRTGREKPNVILLGFDSMSRLNSLRLLRETNDFLRNKLKAVIFNLHVKCGLNTRPNVVTMLTGKRSYPITGKDGEIPAELPHCSTSVCSDDYLDDWPLIWKNFTQKKYTIAHAEDEVEMTAFNYRMKGFRKSPTYHYMRPYWLAWDRIRYKTLFTKSIDDGCVMHQPRYQVTLNWMLDLMRNYRSSPLFGMFMSTYTHDILSQYQVLDQPVLKALRTLNEEGLMENTIFIFFGDHGLRMGKYRETWMGRLEDNMPYFSMVLPKWMKLKYPHLQEALVHNQNRLTTWYDLHATLLDVLDENFEFNGEYHEQNGRGLSLFKKISETRTCIDAGIPLSFCPCLKEKKVEVNNESAVDAAREVVITINKYLSGTTAPCAKLKLLKVVEATSFKMQEDGDNDDVGMRIVFQVSPSDGIFETTVSYSESERKYITGEVIERLDKYHGQDYCIKDHNLERYCYCQS